MNELEQAKPCSEKKKNDAEEDLRRGYFFSFEGIDYCGKTTQTKRLLDYLKGSSVPAILGAEHGTTSLGQVLRKILKEPRRMYVMYNREFKLDPNFEYIDVKQERNPASEMLLFLAARREFVTHFVLPNLEQGITVLADRFADSTRAYQGGGRFNSDPWWIDMINRLNNGVINGAWPDRTFFLDISYDNMLARARSNGKCLDAIESLGDAFFQRVIDEYRRIAAENPERVVAIDGTLDPDRIFNYHVLRSIDALFAARKS